MVERRRAKVVATHGSKQIVVKLRFETHGMTAEKETRVPRHARDTGWATLDSNETHGLKGQEKAHFNSLMEISSAVEKVLTAGGIQLHHTGKAKKYIQTE